MCTCNVEIVSTCVCTWICNVEIVSTCVCTCNVEIVSTCVCTCNVESVSTCMCTCNVENYPWSKKNIFFYSTSSLLDKTNSMICKLKSTKVNEPQVTEQICCHIPYIDKGV